MPTHAASGSDRSRRGQGQSARAESPVGSRSTRRPGSLASRSRRAAVPHCQRNAPKGASRPSHAPHDLHNDSYQLRTTMTSSSPTARLPVAARHRPCDRRAGGHEARACKRQPGVLRTVFKQPGATSRPVDGSGRAATARGCVPQAIHVELVGSHATSRLVAYEFRSPHHALGAVIFCSCAICGHCHTSVTVTLRAGTCGMMLGPYSLTIYPQCAGLAVRRLRRRRDLVLENIAATRAGYSRPVARRRRPRSLPLSRPPLAGPSAPLLI